MLLDNIAAVVMAAAAAAWTTASIKTKKEN